MICPRCATTFIPNINQKFCSRQCRNQHDWIRKGPLIKTARKVAREKLFAKGRKCPKCSVKFIPRHHRQKHCSHACMVKYNSQRNQARIKNRSNFLKKQGRVCKECAVKFILRDLHQKFCSEKCGISYWRRTRDTKRKATYEWNREEKCQKCSKKFMKKHKRHIYCSKQCMWSSLKSTEKERNRRALYKAAFLELQRLNKEIDNAHADR